MNEKWLIRLMDWKNDFLIASYFTENPEQNLKTFYFCKEHDLQLYIPKELDNERYKYNDAEAGSIEEITVAFGNRDTYSCIDVYLRDIY